MSKKIIILLICGVLLICSIFAVVAFISYKPVKFTLTGEGYTVTVYKGEVEVSKLSTSNTVRLQEGVYSYAVNGDAYNPASQDFTVSGNDTAITVSPQFSADYLTEQLQKERTAIETALTASSTALQNSSIVGLALYEKGDWAAGTINPSTDPRELPDNYRFVLQKKDNRWQVVVSPRIIVSRSDFKDVPDSVLNSLYSAG